MTISPAPRARTDGAHIHLSMSGMHEAETAVAAGDILTVGFSPCAQEVIDHELAYSYRRGNR